MWKIAKNELRYQFTVIYTHKIYYIVAVFLFFALSMSWDVEQILKIDTLWFLLPSFLTNLYQLMPVLYCGTLIHQSILEATGKRVRINSSKPLDIKKLGKARLLSALFGWLIFTLIFFTVCCIAYQSIVWTSSPDMPYFLKNRDVNWNNALGVSMIMLYLIFATRTLFEKYSRIVGITFLGFLLFWYTVLLVTLPKSIYDYINTWIDFTSHPEIAILLSLIFASLTYYSFTRRRSFLA